MHNLCILRERALGTDPVAAVPAPSGAGSFVVVEGVVGRQKAHFAGGYRIAWAQRGAPSDGPSTFTTHLSFALFFL